MRACTFAYKGIVCGAQRATLWGQFSSPTFIWVLGITRRLPACFTNTVTPLSHLTGLWHKCVMETIEHTGFTWEKSGCEVGKGKKSWNLWNKVIARLLNLWARAARPVCYEKLLGAKKISHQCGKFTTLNKWIQWTLIQPQKGKFFWYTYDMDGP